MLQRTYLSFLIKQWLNKIGFLLLPSSIILVLLSRFIDAGIVSGIAASSTYTFMPETMAVGFLGFNVASDKDSNVFDTFTKKLHLCSQLILRSYTFFFVLQSFGIFSILMASKYCLQETSFK